MAASTWFPASTRLAIAFQRYGCAVSAICPAGHTLSLVPGIEKIYSYRRLWSLRSLRQAIQQAKPDLVVPCDDGAAWQLHMLHKQEPSLRPLIERSLGSPASYDIIDRRDASLEAAGRLGIRVPLTHSIKAEADLEIWPHASVVLKTDGSTGGNGVVICHNKDEFKQGYQKLHHPLTFATAMKRMFINHAPLALWNWQHHAQPRVIAQQYIPGRAANTMIACWQGEVLAAITVETLHSQGSTGAATIVRLIHHSEIEEASHRLAQHFQFSGFYGLDFILEPANDSRSSAAYLIEINPRCTQLGHVVLPEQGDLAGAIVAKLRGNDRTEIPIDSCVPGDTIALYPQALIWNRHSPYIRNGYHDVPVHAELAAELLLAEWPLRQWPARLYHHFHPLQLPFDDGTNADRPSQSRGNA